MTTEILLIIIIIIISIDITSTTIEPVRFIKIALLKQNPSDKDASRQRDLYRTSSTNTSLHSSLTIKRKMVL